MNKKIAIIYDLKDKNNSQRTQTIRKLYGYQDKSNYDYNYKRDGLLNKINFDKTKKTLLYPENKKEAQKIMMCLNQLKIKFQLAIIN